MKTDRPNASAPNTTAQYTRRGRMVFCTACLHGGVLRASEDKERARLLVHGTGTQERPYRVREVTILTISRHPRLSMLPHSRKRLWDLQWSETQLSITEDPLPCPGSPLYAGLPSSTEEDHLTKRAVPPSRSYVLSFFNFPGNLTKVNLVCKLQG